MHIDEFLAKVQQGQRDFRNVSLRQANLVGEQLPLLNLDGVNLEESDLSSANLAGSSLAHAHLERAKLVGTNLLGAQCLKADFRGADLSNALLSGAEFPGSDLKQANLSDSSCVGIDFSGASLRYANLTNANLKAAKLKGTDFYGANLEGVDLEGADLENVIWPDGHEEIKVDSLTDDRANFASVSKPQGSLVTPVQPSSEGVEVSNALEVPIRFGDLTMEETEGFRRASSLMFPRKIPQPLLQTPPEAQPANFRIASQIAFRLERQVQYSFKKYVKQVYGDRCALSNSNIPALLEAVVIFPDAEENQDHPSNGLLLRLDLARLFQVNLITIVPDTYQVILAPSLRQSEYANFAGATLRLPTEPRYQPNKAFLQNHYQQCEWLKNPESLRAEPIAPGSSSHENFPSKSFRLVEASKSWMQRINHVLNSPIASPLSHPKTSPEILPEEPIETIVSFAPIGGEIVAEQKTSDAPDSLSLADSIGHESFEADSSEIETLESEPLNSEIFKSAVAIPDLLPSEILEPVENIELPDLPEPEILESVPDIGTLDLPKPVNPELLDLSKNDLKNPFILPSFPSYPPQTSVRQNLDRLQESLDTIAQELAPYLQPSEPLLEDISEILETLEQEIHSDSDHQQSLAEIKDDPPLLSEPETIGFSESVLPELEATIVDFEDLFSNNLEPEEFDPDKPESELIAPPLEPIALEIQPEEIQTEAIVSEREDSTQTLEAEVSAILESEVLESDISDIHIEIPAVTLTPEIPEPIVTAEDFAKAVELDSLPPLVPETDTSHPPETELISPNLEPIIPEIQPEEIEPESIVTAEELAQDFDAASPDLSENEDPPEKPTSTPRRGLAGLLFRRFYKS